MKICVIGGSGRVGIPILRRLREAEHKVVNFDRNRPEEHLCRFHRVDAANLEEIYDGLAETRPDAVVVAAANPNPGGSARHAHFMGNVGIAHGAMQAAADLGIKRLVYLSSEQASGWTSSGRVPAHVPFDEEANTPPESTYALSKLVGETILQSVCGARGDIVGVSLRLSYVHTEKDYERVAHWIDRAGEWPSALMWAYVDARDVADAVLLALETPLAPGHRVYSVAAPDVMSRRPIREMMGRHYPETTVGEEIPEFGSTVSTARIRAELGWNPTRSWRDEPDPASEAVIGER